MLNFSLLPPQLAQRKTANDGTVRRLGPPLRSSFPTPSSSFCRSIFKKSIEVYNVAVLCQ